MERSKNFLTKNDSSVSIEIIIKAEPQLAKILKIFPKLNETFKANSHKARSLWYDRTFDLLTLKPNFSKARQLYLFI